MPVIISSKKFGQTPTEPTITGNPVLRLFDPPTDSQPVDSWTDSVSGTVAWNASGTARPQHATSADLNDNVVLDFDGTDDLMLASTGNEFGVTSNGYTIVATIRVDSIRDSIMFGLRNADNARPIVAFGTTANAAVRFQANFLSGGLVVGLSSQYTADGILAAGNTYVLVGRVMADGSGDVFVNGVNRMTATSSQAGPDDGQVFTDSYIGGYMNASHYFDGQVAELRSYNYGMDDTEVQTLTDELRTTYGV